MKLLDVDYKKVEAFEKEQGIEIEVHHGIKGGYWAGFSINPVKGILVKDSYHIVDDRVVRTGNMEQVIGTGNTIQDAINKLIILLSVQSVRYEHEEESLTIPNLFKEVPLNFNPPDIRDNWKQGPAGLQQNMYNSLQKP